MTDDLKKYKHKYKGISLCLDMLGAALGVLLRYLFTVTHRPTQNIHIKHLADSDVKILQQHTCFLHTMERAILNQANT